ncbi:MAG: hypothetical protein AVDCRST_MAG83-3241, partial [uncultured Arthrobacter sp.]
CPTSPSSSFRAGQWSSVAPSPAPWPIMPLRFSALGGRTSVWSLPRSRPIPLRTAAFSRARTRAGPVWWPHSTGT